MPEESIAALEQRRAHLCQQLASIGEMRSGSLMARCRRCGKTGCGCAPPGKAQRGPVLSLTRKQSGKTVTRIIPARAAEQAWAEAAEYRRFRRLSQELIEASDALSEARLRAGSGSGSGRDTAAAAAGAGKRGFKETLAAEIATEIDALVEAAAVGGQDFEAFEQAVRRRALDTAARSVERSGRSVTPEKAVSGARVPAHGCR